MTDRTQHFEAGDVAVITGAAMGIGESAAETCAKFGMHLVLIDTDAESLRATAARLAHAGAASVTAEIGSVADGDWLRDVAARTTRDRGAARLLMNNAVTRIGGPVLESGADWRESFDINFWGVVQGVEAFLPPMLETNQRAFVVNVGSKQGITNPPGKPIYNVAKAALKSYTELLQHELRNRDGALVSAHLLIPGFTTTGQREHQPGAWLPAQVVEKMFTHLARNSFYILCPDNEVTAKMDRKRVLWSARDIVDDRPAMSRWSGEHDQDLERYEGEP